MIKRLIDGLRARRFVRKREQLLESENPVLAFASNPAAGTQQLRPGETNDSAFALLRNGDVSLMRVHDRTDMLARAFDKLIFVEPWDPLSMTVVGSHRRPFEAGRLGSFGIVFISTARADFASHVADAWYKPVAFVLEDEDLHQRIASVPFVVAKAADGSVTFAEGLEECRFRGANREE